MMSEGKRKKRRRKGVKRQNRPRKVLITLLIVLAVVIVGVGGMAAKVYFDVKGTADGTFQSVERSSNAKKDTADLTTKEPFSILLLGVDTGALGRTYKGRSDTMILATVNPSTNETYLVSLERDTYAEIVGKGTSDKINHAYAFGGASMAMDTVEQLLDVPVNHYITINMAGIESLVDAVGGVTVDNPFEFTYSGVTFTKGKQTLDGSDALKYSRMRYDDPNGDYGRQKRQRQVISSIAKKALNISELTKYQQILTAMGDNVQTDLSFSDMTTIARNYRSAFGNIQDDQLQGTGFMQDGVSYQRVSDEEINRVSTILKTQLGEN